MRAMLRFSFLVILLSAVVGVSVYAWLERKNSDSKTINLFTPFDGDEYGFPYRLYVPQAEEPLPLLVYLHGAGSRGDDNISQLEFGPRYFVSQQFQSRWPCLVLVPQCPPGKEWVEHGYTQPPYLPYRMENVAESELAQSLVRLIEAVKSKNDVLAEQTYVTGFSMGATAVYDLICRYPDLFAGAVPVSGVNDPQVLASRLSTSLWSWHGEEDVVSPVSNTTAAVSGLVNDDSIRMNVVSGGGHDVTKDAYGYDPLFEWLFEQK